MYEYLLEYIGTLLVCAAVLFTNENPILVGLAHTSATYIGGDRVKGAFNPVTVISRFVMKRLTLKESLKLIAVQVAAGLSIAVLYIPVITDFNAAIETAIK
jgi:glycerol uptake facilitator-like aquaporin